MSRYDDRSAGSRLLSQRESKANQRSGGNGQEYPYNAINSHRQIQRHIDYERAQPIRVPSEQTRVYVKNSDGYMEKTDRYGNKVGRRQVPGIDQHHLIQLQKQSNIDISIYWYMYLFCM